MSRVSRIVQIVLLVALIAAGVRFYLSMRDRQVTFVTPERKEVALDPDYYVTPKKLHPQDLKDAKELTQQPVWVREGYRYAYYPYGTHADFKHQAGTLGPIERLDVKDVVLERAPEVAGRQVMAVFEKEGKRYAFSVGLEDDGSYSIYSDDMLFVQDPHELYKHWPEDAWKAIRDHQVKPGMNELQASFAIGVGAPEGMSASSSRVVNYPNQGHPVKVTFENGKAIDIKQGD